MGKPKRDYLSPAAILERFKKHVEGWDGPGCWLWRGAKYPNGYGAFRLVEPSRTVPAHRWLLELTTGRQLSHIERACHHCDIPLCVNPAHLFVGSPADNSRDMAVKGRSPNRKLNDSVVQEIRHRYAAGGITHHQLGRQYGVSEAAICHAISGRNWGHL